MSEVTCDICLDDLKSPVSTPCGHLHCKKCMYEHVKSSTDAVQSTCPTCRTSFYTVTLDPTFVPEKYHPFIVPALRRIYLSTDPSRASAASRQLQEQLAAVKKENEDLASKLKGRDRDIKLLMTKCESHMAAAATHAKGERDARVENERLRHEISHLAERYRTLQVKSPEREHRTEPSGGDEGRPKGDQRWGHSHSQPRSISDPLRSFDVNGHSLDKPINQTAGSPNTAPTVVNKRKYAASTTSASLSLSSSASSSTPSTPVSDASRETSNPGERSMFSPRWPRQMTKRPRLDPAPSGGNGTARLRETFAPPPVFRRRPPTPFNRSSGETSAASGDQVEGFSSDDSLNLPVSRLR